MVENRLNPTFLSSGVLFVLFFLPFGCLAWGMTGSLVVGFLGVLLALVAWKFPFVAVGILLASAPLARSPQSAVFSPESLALAKCSLALIVSAVWLLIKKLRRENVEFPTVGLIFLLAWFSLALLSTVQSGRPSASLQNAIVLLGGVGLFAVTMNGPETVHKRFVFIVLAVSFGVCAVSFLQYAMVQWNVLEPLRFLLLNARERSMLLTGGFTDTARIFRVSGTFPHSNHLGTYLAVMLPLAVALLPHGQTARRRLAGLILVAAMIAALTVSNSRAGLLAAGVALGYLAFFRDYRWLWMVGAAALILFISAAVISPDRTRHAFLKISRIQSGISSREGIWANMLTLISRNPWLGVGPGNVNQQYAREFGLFLFDNPEELRYQMTSIHAYGDDLVRGYHAHNTFLHVAAGLGIAAGLLYIIGMGSLLIVSTRRARAAPFRSYGRACAAALGAVTLGLLALGMFDAPVLFSELGLSLLAGPLVAIGLRA